MTRITSLFLWMAGAVFFLFSFCFLAVCLMVLSRKALFHLARRLFTVLIRIMGIRLKVRGRSHIDPGQTYLIMGNHQSLFDLFVIPAAIPLVFTGIEAAYHFNIPVWGYLIRKWGCIPIQRGNLAAAKKSLARARATLESGLSIAVLPEGHRTRTGRLGPFKKGPFHLARQTRASILPFGIHGLFDFQQRGGFLLRPGSVRVTIGRPMAYQTYAHLSVEQLRDRVFHTIQALSREKSD